MQVAARFLFLLLPLASASTARPETPSPLIFVGDMESDSLDAFTFAVDGKNNPAPAIVTAPVRHGNRAAAFRVVRAPEGAPAQYRCEMVARAKGTRKNYLYQEIGREYWYGFSVFLPADWVFDDEPEIIAQWHGVPDDGEDWRNPPLAIRIQDRSYRLERHWDADRITFRRGQGIDPKRYDGSEEPPLGTCEGDLGKWTDWVLHVRWDYRADGAGFTELWKNGHKVFDRKGPNCFNDATGPFFRFGLYKWPWRHPRAKRPSKTETRTTFHDEIRIGGAGATYRDVAPPGGDRTAAPARPR